MASNRKYAYYLRGGQISLIEEGIGSGVCSLSGYSNQTTCEAAGGTWTENARGTDDGVYRSPTASVSNGLEIEYTYAPTFNIYTDKNTGNFGGLFHTNATFVLDGYVCFARAILNGTAVWTGTNPATAGSEGDTGGQSLDYIVVKGSSRWSGLHRIQTAGAAFGTLLGGIIKTYTRAEAIGPYVTAADLDLGTDETVTDGGTESIHMADRGFEVGDYVWMSGFTDEAANNGVFTISAVTPDAAATSSTLTFDTRYFMPSSNSDTHGTEETATASFTADADGGSKLVTVAKIEHEICEMYTNVDVLNDESDELPIPEYLSKALVYYVKARIAEDVMDLKTKEYYMHEFYSMIEKHNSAKTSGPFRMMTGSFGIK